MTISLIFVRVGQILTTHAVGDSPATTPFNLPPNCQSQADTPPPQQAYPSLSADAGPATILANAAYASRCHLLFFFHYLLPKAAAAAAANLFCSRRGRRFLLFFLFSFVDILSARNHSVDGKISETPLYFYIFIKDI